MPFFKLLILLTMSSSALAEQLGTIGQIYPIGEESALTMIMSRLHQKEHSGELKKLQSAAVKQAVHSMSHMSEVPGIVTVVMRRQRRVDPSVRYDQALTTDTGEIVIPAGTTINPLDIMRLSKRLVFFDGRDPEQIAAVERMVQLNSTKVKPILVAGSWLDLTKNWKHQVYFDQKGILSKRFGIQAVPTVISQQGNALLHEEIPAKELQ